jgi:hypothetical protein
MKKYECAQCGKKLYKKEACRCTKCGKVFCGEHVYSYVDGNNISITKNSPELCADCASVSKIKKSFIRCKCQEQENIDHEKFIRGFVWANKAWYAKYNNIKNGLIHFGIYSSQGGTTGEMSVEWIEIGDENIPRLNVFNDAWKTLAEFKDIIDALGRMNGKKITDADFVKILLDYGFTDLTKYTEDETS